MGGFFGRHGLEKGNGNSEITAFYREQLTLFAFEQGVYAGRKGLASAINSPNNSLVITLKTII